MIAYPLAVYLIWRLIILLFQIYIQPFYKLTPDSLYLWDRLFNSWTTYWDASHYLSIATSGYNFPQQAFFPLWPLLIKVTIMLGLSSQTASYFLTFILGFLNFILFYLLAAKLVGKIDAKWALVFFSCYPGAIFLHAGYSENLLLFSTLLSFLLLENKKYYLAALSAGFSTASRMVGVGTVISFWFINTTIRNRLFMSIVGILGLVSYMIFLYLNYGDFWFFIKGQQAWCQAAGRCNFTFPLTPLLQYGRLLILGWVRVGLSSSFIDWFSSVAFLSLLFLVWQKLPRYYFIYSLIVLSMPLLSGSTVSMIRLTQVAFPVFFILPKVLKNKPVMIVVASVLLLLELRFVAFFTSRLWVA